MSLMHTSYLLPRVYPFNGTVAPSQIDRVQDMSGSQTLNRERIREIGRDGTVDWVKRIPSVRLSLRQLDYGKMAFFQQLANRSDRGDDGEAGIDIATDFKTSMVDICGFETDDDSTFIGTIWYPKLRLASWNINIGDPQSFVERSFEFVGEDEVEWLNNNKYFIYRSFSASGGTNESFTLADDSTYPYPNSDPDASGSNLYILRVVRVTAAGVSTELTYTTDYTYSNSTHAVTVLTTTASDTIKVYWTADTLGSSTTLFTNNDTDLGAITADSCSIYLQTSDYLYRVQSCAIDVSYDRTDYYEIGNDDVIQRGIRDKTVRITLGRILDDFTIEQVLRNVSSTYGKIDGRRYQDNLTLYVNMYTDKTKGTFLMGYRFTGLSPVSDDNTTPLNDYMQRSVVLEGESGVISADSSIIATGS